MRVAALALLSVLVGTSGAAQTLHFSSKVRHLDGNAYRAVTGDFNNDGKLDIAALVSVGGKSILQVFLGKGDGTFHITQIHQLGVAATEIATADLNRDGVPDLVIESVQVDREATTAIPKLTLYVGLGNGSFRIAKDAIRLPAFNISPASSAPLNIGDVDGDGIPDIVFGPHYAADTVPNHSEITVLRGNGDGTFHDAVESLTDISVYISGIGPAALGDVTNDGMAELIATYEYRGGSGELEVFNGQSDGTMVRSYTAPLPPSGVPCCTLSGPVTGDFNGDGRLDFAADLGLGFQIYLQDIGHFAPAGLAEVVPPNAAPPVLVGGVTAGDLDGDGKTDLVFAEGNGVIFLRGKGDGTFVQPAATDPRPSWYVGTSPIPLKIADINGDGKPDLVVLTDTSIVVLLQSSPDAPHL
jgi:FG-GAP-like repeat